MEGSKGRILLLEGEKTVQEATAEVLEYMGYSVACADDIREVLKIHYVAKRYDFLSFDAAIIDSEILKRKGEAAIISCLRRIDPGMRIILSSTYPTPGAFPNIQGIGIDGMIIKPYRIKSLEAVLKWIIQGNKKNRALMGTGDTGCLSDLG